VIAAYAEDLLPSFDVSDKVGVRVAADPERTWEALMEVDLIELGRRAPLVGVLGGLRALPEVIANAVHGERPVKPPRPMTLGALPSLPMTDGGWLLLGERPGEIALGLIGKFWRPVIEFAAVADAEGFRAFDQPGFAKTVYDLAVTDLGDSTTLLSGSMRTATTDEHARAWFRRYWTFGVGSGAHVLVRALLEAARDAAEGDAE
jgi:hypothetical protein